MVVVTSTDTCIPVTYHHNCFRGRLQIHYVMPAARLTLREEDVVRLALEFLHNRELHISQLSLERETGVINGGHSDDVLFLRQLILDGQWDDVLEFIQPLEALRAFDMRRFVYAILKHKYIELLCIRSEASAAGGGGGGVDTAVDEVVRVLAELEKVAPSKDEHAQMCLLLTLPRLSDHLSYRDWNPSSARVQCFREVHPLVADFLPADRKPAAAAAAAAATVAASARNDRLIQLIIKGVLYESCVNYCQAKASSGGGGGGSEPQEAPAAQEMSFATLLDGSVGFSDSDLSLLSWLQSIPAATFGVPFEQRTLNVDVERLERPSLETSWTEHILVTPIKPKTFPHSAMPCARPRSAMTRSLMAIDGGANASAAAAASAASAAAPGGDLSRSSFASFHLTGMRQAKAMNSSVDRLFESDAAGGGSEVFLSSSSHAECQPLPAIREAGSTSTTAAAGADSPASRSSRRDSLSERPMSAAAAAADAPMEQSFSGDLLREFQMQKQRVMTSIAIKEREREELLRQINLTAQLGDAKAASAGKTNGVIPSRTASASPRPNLNGTEHPRPISRQDLASETQYESVKAATRPSDTSEESSASGRPRFVAVTSLEDVQAVRCAEFHPSGHLYAVGSNSKTLRICAYPKLGDLREEHQTYQPTVLFKRTKHHKGSIYCLAWSPVGDLMATGSNDKTVKLMRFNADTSNLEGDEVELSMHDGTVRDLCFLEDVSNQSSLLISGGAGDCKIYVTDCATGTPFQALSGHAGHVLALYTWGGAMFVSGSHDRSVRFWDLRTRGCVNMVTPVTAPGTRQGAPVAAVCVDPSGRLLVSGHEDSSCVLYDIRGGRNIQCFKPHAADVRSVRFSPSAYYLLSAGYDNKMVLTDLQGDLTLPLPSVVVAQHHDKVISGRWHPSEFSFLSTSADKTATLWALPPL